ncbi:6-carboxyhexanoate-CoA ligase [Humitalea rosea]|uniref:6-carboxyhexanoate-CoA ligase n=1 Tax=Humitalea rosea TaxID=990373 RepID=A0A2W7IKQ4_9PROT|nr:acetate--CoA ligase family protein [Humitalea rosea]PZW45865.1 6-carboxyhexanoate-CoA ligase [Humitalea rosea]
MADDATGGAGAPGFSALDPLIRPRSVAVIGASDDPTRIGGRPISYMLDQGFTGAILPVNPRRATVQGLPAYASIADLPVVPDVAIIAVPAAAAAEALGALGAKGCRAAIMFTAGFAEVDAAGARAQEELLAIARRHGIRMLGPNCLGVFNAAIGHYGIFSSSFENGWPHAAGTNGGRIGIASQSGAYGTHLFAIARDRGIGTPLLVTTGNEADVGLAEVIGWMATAPEVDVIMAYAEGIKDGPRFLEALALARANRKPVVMMKVGRSALGQAAAQSHTASVAGDDAVTDAVLREAGVVRARTTEELLDIAYAATQKVYPAVNTLGVVTVSGGAGVLISDAAESLGLLMPPMPQAAQDALRAKIPFSSPRNPVDCTAHIFNDMTLVGDFTRSMVEDGGYASVIAFFTQVGASSTVAPELRRHLKAVRDAHPDRLWILSIVAPVERLREYEADGFLCFEDPTRAVVAAAAMGRFGQAFAIPAPEPPPALEIELPDVTPTEAVAKQILAEAGIPIVEEFACADAEAAVAAATRIGFPVVMKILSPDILHKSEIGGVLLGVADEEAVRAGFARIMERATAAAPKARIEGVLVARQISGGVEIAMGILRDPVFGPVAMVALGGIFIEIFKDTAFRRCPFGVEEAETMIRSLRGFPLLDGARGRPVADVPALAAALSVLSRFAAGAGPTLLGVDVNPMLVLPAGQGAWAADAVIEIGGGPHGH